MNQLIAGHRDPKALPQLARGRARRKISELEHTLEGAKFFHRSPGAPAAGHAGAHRPDRRGDHRLSEVIETLLTPHEEQRCRAPS